MADFSSKYGVARHIYIPLVKVGSNNHAATGDWTPVAGDVKIKKDTGAAANVTNLPVAVAMGNSTVWDFSLTATEMQAAQVIVTIGDSATKAVEDDCFIIETYGNASAQLPIDFSDSSFGLNVFTFAQPGIGTPPTTGITMAAFGGWLMKIAFNKFISDGAVNKLYNADDVTVDQKQTISYNSGTTTTTKTRFLTGP